MRLRLKSQRSEFFVLFSQAAQNTVEITALLKELLGAYPDDGRELIFSILSNGSNLSSAAVGSRIDAVVRELARVGD